MARLTRLMSLMRLTWLSVAAIDPLSGPPVESGPPIEFASGDGVLFRTQDGAYFGASA